MERVGAFMTSYFTQKRRNDREVSDYLYCKPRSFKSLSAENEPNFYFDHFFLFMNYFKHQFVRHLKLELSISTYINTKMCVCLCVFVCVLSAL